MDVRSIAGVAPVRSEGTWRGLPYVVSGSGERLLYLPGITATHRLPTGTERWFQLAEITPYTRAHEVWWVNRRAHLRGEVTLPGLARDYAGFVRDRLGAPVDVIGLSTGGSVALWLATEHPDAVRRLVVVSAAHRLSPLGRAAQRVMAESARCGRTHITSSAMFAPLGTTPRSRALLAMLGFALGSVGFGRGDEDMVATLEAEDAADVASRLGDVRAPTLLVAGDQDGFFDRSQYERTAAAIPDCRLVLLPGRGHLPTHISAVSGPALEFLAAR